jgi:hypothetical protein
MGFPAVGIEIAHDFGALLNVSGYLAAGGPPVRSSPSGPRMALSEQRANPRARLGLLEAFCRQQLLADCHGMGGIARYTPV